MALALLAQDRPPALPLAITQTWIETSDPLPAGTSFPRVEVLNTGQRMILAWGVRYVLKRPDGQHVPSGGFSTDSASVPPTIAPWPSRRVERFTTAAVAYRYLQTPCSQTPQLRSSSSMMTLRWGMSGRSPTTSLSVASGRCSGRRCRRFSMTRRRPSVNRARCWHHVQHQRP